MRILIVDDSDSIRGMIQTLMTARGHEVEAVSTGAKAIDAALAQRPDAILLDVHLPGAFDGIEVMTIAAGVLLAVAVALWF